MLIIQIIPKICQRQPCECQYFIHCMSFHIIISTSSAQCSFWHAYVQIRCQEPATASGEWHMRRECRERTLTCHRLHRKPLVSDPDMHQGVTNVPWCMSGPLTHGGEIVPGIPGAVATRNFTHLERGPSHNQINYSNKCVPIITQNRLLWNM